MRSLRFVRYTSARQRGLEVLRHRGRAFGCLLAALLLIALTNRAGAASVTAATGGSAISADSTGGTFTTLTGPVLDEGSFKEFGTGTIILNAPSGFIFDTGSTVTATVTRISGSGTTLTLSSGTATPATSTITFNISNQDSGGSTVSRITFSNIKVRPSVGTPLATGNITNSGAAANVPSGANNYGTLVEVAGAANRLAITTTAQTLTAGVSSGTITVQRRDQFNNAVTNEAGRTVNFSTTSGGGTFRNILDTTTITSLTIALGSSTTNFLYRDTVAGSPTITAASTSPTTITSATQGETVNAAGASQVRVETAANGSGSVVGAQTLNAGVSLTVYSIERDAFGNFTANGAATSWSVVNTTGGVAAGDLVPAGDSKSAVFTGHCSGTGQIRANKTGLTSVDSGVLTVQDLTLPVAVCRNITRSLGSDGTVSVSASDINNGSSDNCAVSELKISKNGTDFFDSVSYACGEAGANTATLRVKDAAGNTSTCTSTVTIQDTTAPSITCPANITKGTDADVCTTTASWTTPSGSDNCAVASVVCSPASGSTFNKGVTTVTCTATDTSGNTNACTFTVTVNDTQVPTISCPGNITVDTAGGSCASNVIFAATAADNCSGVTYACLPASGSSFPRGITTVTCTATDTSGNTNACTFTVTVNDNESPAILCPANIVVSTAGGSCASNVTFSATATDNCGSATVNCSPASGSSFALGTTPVSCTADDGHGNTASCNFTVTVNDTEKPSITCPANITQSTATGLCTADVSWTAPTAADNCVLASVACVPASGSTFNKGVMTVTCTATDGVGNTNACTFTVTVNDTENPVIAACPANITQNTDAGLCTAVVTYSTPSATDNCAGVTVSCSPASGGAFPRGETTVTCTATDTSGNTNACTFTVTINDSEAPAITCPANIVVGTAGGSCASNVVFAATATDNCGTATVSCSPTSGSSFGLGVTPVMCTANDGHGNTASCNFTVTVNDTEKPSITCPANITQGNDPGVCTADVTWSAPIAADNCSVPTVACLPASGSTFAKGVTTVTCTATDAAGNTNACTFTVTVNDTENPVIAACPVNITQNTDGGLCTAVVNFTAPGATDNCPGATVSCVPASGSAFPRGTMTVTCTATDTSGNTNACTFTVTVNDNESPAILCPANIVVSTAGGSCASNVTFSATATDNCGSATVNCSPASGSSFALGTTPVSCMADDGHGNTASCNFTVTVNDTEKPSITCPANITQSTAAGLCTADVSWTAPTAADNCVLASVACVPTSGSTFNKGVTTVTCTATDASGNTNACTFTVTVNDTENPVIGTCPTDITQNTDAGLCTAVVTFTAPGATDNCPGATVSCSPASGSAFVRGVTIVTCTATDASGNTNACTFNVTINDSEVPAITCPANIVVSTAGGSCASNVVFSATATDNCGTATVTCSPVSGSSFGLGVTPVMCTANDGHGNTASCNFTVTVNDTEKPSITCPANITQSTDPGVCTADVTWSAPIAADNCSVPTVACVPVSGSTFAKGVTTVTCTATDAAGNTNACTFTVTVNDTENPVVGVCPADITQNTDAGVCTAVVSYAAPSPTDNCPDVTVGCIPASGSAFPKGTTTVTCTATDTSGNTNACTFTVTINDTQAPTIACPSDIVVSTAGGSCASNVIFTATAADNCSGVTYACVPSSGSSFAKGTTLVTCTATDTSGNTAECSFNVTVNDTQAPTISCPSDITVSTAGGSCASNVVFTATAADNCPGVIYACVPPSGSSFDRGTTLVTCTATDTTGNTNACTFHVTVNDTEPPAISCPANIVVTAGAGTCSSNVTFTTTATDNCGTATVTCTPASGSTFTLGVTTVSCTANDGHGNTASCNFTVTVNRGPFVKLQLLLPGETAAPGTANGKTGTPTARTAGSAFNVTINAVDDCWNVIDSVTDTVALTSSDSIATLPGTTALVAGTKTLSVTLNTSGTQTLTASDVTQPDKASNTSPGVTVNPSTLHHFGVSVSSPQTAGTPFSITLTAQDQFNNTVPSFSGTVALTSTAGTITPTTSGAFSSGVRAENVTLTQAGAAKTITATRTGGTETGTSAPFTVNPGAFTKLQLLVPGENAAPGTGSGKTGSPTARTAGAAFNVTVNAVDANWNVVSTISDTVRITSSDSNATLPADTALSSGTQTLSVTLRTAGTRTLTASDITDIGKTASTSPSITVNVGPISKLQILLPGETANPGSALGKTGSPTARTAGAPIAGGIIVNAVDADWNVITTATTNVIITSSDSNAIIADDNGVGTAGNLTLLAGTRTLTSFTFKTAGTQTITASDAGGVLTANTSANVTVNAGAIARLQLLLPGETAAPGTATGKLGLPSAQTAGAAIANAITINAVDTNWNVVSTATTNVTITSTDTNAAIADDNGGAAGNVTLVAGTRTLSSFMFKTAGPRTITAAAIGFSTNTSPSVTVNPGAFTKLQLLVPGETAAAGTALGKIGSPTARIAGTSFNVTANAVDDCWNVVNTVTDTVGITSSDSNATLPADAALASGTQTFSVTFKTAGSQTLTATDVVDNTKTANTSPSITVNAGTATKLQVLLPGETAAPGTLTGKIGSPSAQTAGTAITSGVIVNAVDANWNVVSTAVPNVTITSSDTNATIADDNGVTTGNITLVSGTRTLSSFTFRTAGTRTITAAATGFTANTSPNVTVNVGAFTKLQILVPGETAAPGSATGKSGTASAQTVVTPFNVTVNAVDANWNLINTVTDLVGITTSDPNAPLPADAALVGGTQTFSVSFKTSGPRTVTASDLSDPSKTANISSAITVNPGAFVKLQLLVPGETAAAGTTAGKTGTPNAQTAGTAFSVTVNAVDANWNVVSSVSDNIAVSTTDANDTEPANNTLLAGTRSFSVTFRTAGSATITATDATDGNKTGNTSPSITVNAGAITKLQILLPGETAAPGTTLGKIGSPSAQTAGTAIANGIIVNGVDANWNIVSTATTNVTITTTDANATIADDNGGTAGNLSLVSGTRTLSSFTFKTAGTRTITATAAPLTANTSASVIVNAGAFAKLQLLVPGETASPGTATGKTGTPSAWRADLGTNVTVNAVDANWNLVNTVTDTVGITSTDSQAILPANAPLVAGTKIFSVTLETPGTTTTVTASDVIDGTKTASTSPALTVNAAQYTPATGGNAISADTTGGTYTKLFGPVYTEAATADVGGGSLGTIVLNAPAGFVFDDTGSPAPTVIMNYVTGGNGDASRNINDLTNNAAIPVTRTPTNLTITITAPSENGASCKLTWTNIHVRPTAGTPLATGNITKTGTATLDGVTDGTSNFGRLIEVVGTAARLAFTTQPGGATVGAIFTTQPALRSEDQFGNVSTNGLGASKIVTLTASSGTLQGTATKDIGMLAGAGVATFTNLRLDSAGSRTLTASAPGFTSTNSAPFTVAKGDQTVTFGALANKTYGDAPFAVSATASSGLAVSFSIVSGPATVSGNTITIAGAGTVIVRASQPGDANWNAAASVDQSFSVAKATLTVTAANKTRAYGAANPTFTASYSGFVNGDTLATSDVTGTPSLTTTATTSSSVAGSPYVITAAQGSLSSANYNFVFVNGSLTVTGATLTVTAADKTRVYGAPNPTLTANYSGFVNGEDETVLSGSPSLSTAANATSTVSGSPYAITVTQGTLSAANYTFSFVNGQLTVTKADTTVAVVSSSNPSCSGQSVTFTATVNVVAPGTGNPTGSVVFSDDGTPVLTNTVTSGQATFSTTNLTVGSHSITAAYVGDDNFNTSASATLTQTVNANPTCSITGADMVDTGSSGNSYSAPADMISYQWSISGNGSISGGNSSQLVSVIAGAPGSFTLTLTITDANGCSSTCQKVVAVNCLAVTIACPANITTNSDPAVCSRPVPFSVTTQYGCPDAGTVSVNCTAAGATTGTVSSGSSFNKGVTTVTCVATDGANNTANCNFTVTVTADPPVANNDSVGALENHSATISADKLVANDTGATGTTLSVTAVSATSTNGGTVTLSAGVITYTPVAAFSGVDLFTYTLSDGCSTASGTVLVTVTDESEPAANLISGPTVTEAGAAVRFACIPGFTYQIERSTDGVNWTVIDTVVAPASGLLDYLDAGAPVGPLYYRTSTP